MHCPKCQAENPDKNSFCRECGSKFQLSCPECSAGILSSDKFCGKCGHPLEKHTHDEVVDYSKPQSYTPKFLAEKILTNRNVLEGERKLVTVLFADVANFTAMSERLDPEEVHQIMDGCFNILMNEIHRLEGTMNQFTGDGIMALFGAPLAHEDHAQRACHAALAVKKALETYQKMILDDYGIEFQMRIGINSGPVVVGAIGDNLRMDYTAIGDTTNLAARLESCAKPGTILISDQVQKLVQDYFDIESIGKVRVKGKKNALIAYTLNGTAKVEDTN